MKKNIYIFLETDLFKTFKSLQVCESQFLNEEIVYVKLTFDPLFKVLNNFKFYLLKYIFFYHVLTIPAVVGGDAYEGRLSPLGIMF